MGQTHTVSRSLLNFALRFNSALENNETTICSPLSAEIVLAMLALGCKGQTHAELMKSLDISDEKVLGASIGNIKSIYGATLKMANRIYVSKNETIKPEIETDIKNVFDTSLEQLDFEKREESAKLINEWVAKRTNNLINDIASADMFDQQTSLVLVNAIHFKSDWDLPFVKELTADRHFHVNKTIMIRKLPQMSQHDVYMNFGVSTKLQAKILEMEYKGRQSSMVIVLPDEIEGLNKILQQLASGHDLMADIKALESTKIDIRIPKFKAEMTINLKNVLRKLGIETIFDPDCSDIDLLTSNKRLYVSKAIQKAFIDVDEAGTEAAAASLLGLKDKCDSSIRNQQFIADHPFLYLLLVKDIPVFVGTYYGPQS